MLNFKVLIECSKCAKKKLCLKRIVVAALVDGYLERKRAKISRKYWERKLFNADCFVKE